MFKKNTPKLVLHNNDLYNNQMENHPNEEPEDKDNRVYFNIQSEDEINRNYELIEEIETTL